MSEAQSQFSPAQIYAAGLRAEHEGRLDHARQFYDHVATHMGEAPEASLARQALARLSGATAQAQPQQSGADRHDAIRPAHGHEQGQRHGPGQVSGHASGHVAGLGPSPSSAHVASDPRGRPPIHGQQRIEPAFGTTPGFGAPPPPDETPRSAPSQSGPSPSSSQAQFRSMQDRLQAAAQDGGFASEPPRGAGPAEGYQSGQSVRGRQPVAQSREADVTASQARTVTSGGTGLRMGMVMPGQVARPKYVAGRAVALLLTVLGGLLIFIGMVCAGAALTVGADTMAAFGVPAIVLMPPTVVAVLGAGCGLILIGQLASAGFDAANATRIATSITVAQAVADEDADSDD